MQLHETFELKYANGGSDTYKFEKYPPQDTNWRLLLHYQCARMHEIMLESLIFAANSRLVSLPFVSNFALRELFYDNSEFLTVSGTATLHIGVQQHSRDRNNPTVLQMSLTTAKKANPWVFTSATIWLPRFAASFSRHLRCWTCESPHSKSRTLSDISKYFRQPKRSFHSWIK